MRNRFFFAFILLAASQLSCRQPVEVEGFNREAWRSDPGGCQGIRVQVWEQFKPVKQNLIGYEENDLSKLVGPPDSKNLLEKGQKTYTYFISGSPRCPEKAPARKLVVRVNATGKISEVQEANN